VAALDAFVDRQPDRLRVCQRREGANDDEDGAEGVRAALR